MKESVRPNGRRRRVKSRTSTPPLSSDQSNAETTKRLWFWLRSVNERKFKDEEKIRDRENFERFSKTNSHPFSEHVNGHRLFLSW
jgi:hypothetical protein